MMVLQMIFGVIQSSLSNHLTLYMHILIYVLQQIDHGMIKRPDAAKVREYQEAVQFCHPLLPDVWCTMDGIKLMLECLSEEDVQNRF